MPPGFALCGFGTGEDPGPQREALVSAVVAKLPEGKPRLMSGVVRGGGREMFWEGGTSQTASPPEGYKRGGNITSVLHTPPHTALLSPSPSPSQSSPSEVLDAVAQGVDLFDCAYTAAGGGFQIQVGAVVAVGGGEGRGGRKIPFPPFGQPTPQQVGEEGEGE